MAKLGAFYGLCPLIDHHSLLGICEDEVAGVVIATLGKNIAIKYQLSDQKQLHSWRTKEKFTSPVIFDAEISRYVAVFNHSYIRIWSGEEESLDKLKKLKFNEQIYTLFECGNKGFVVFKNGKVYPLKEAIENRKKLDADAVISESENIINVLCMALSDIYIGLVVVEDNKHYLYWTKFENSTQNHFTKIVLTRPGFQLIGQVFHQENKSPILLSFWSDGKVFSLNLLDEVEAPGQLFTVIEFLVCKDYISVVSLDENYLALYGCSCNDEGALLAIYNIQFKVVQCKQPFKLFSRGAKLWKLKEKLFLPVGQNLAVVPFNLDTEQLAALVASHKQTDPDIEVIQKVQSADWGYQTKRDKLVPQGLVEYLKQGLPESVIAEEVLNNLMEKKDLEKIHNLINYFMDIPEKCLVKLMKFVVTVKTESFKDKTCSDVTNFPEQLQPSFRAKLIELIFIKSFNEDLLLPYLRSELDVEHVVTLIQYICVLLSEDGNLLPNLDFVQSEVHLIAWGCALLDANYQKLLLTRDDNIKAVLARFTGLVKTELDCLNDLSQVIPLLDEIKQGKSMHRAYIGNLSYTIEKMKL